MVEGSPLIANIVVTVILIGTACWWGPRVGLFRAVIGLVITIMAAAVAVAVWEPLVLGVLIYWLPKQAWGVGLIGAFLAAGMVLWIASMVVVRQAVPLGKWVETVGGGVAGLSVGVIITGMASLAVGFIPAAADTLGYEPATVDQAGRVTRNPDGELWRPVDRTVAHLLTHLSTRSLAGDHPLTDYQPNLIDQGALWRDANTAQYLVPVLPEDVTVTAAYVWPMPIDGLDEDLAAVLHPPNSIRQHNKQLIVIDTRWALPAKQPSTGPPHPVRPSVIRLGTRPQSAHATTQTDLRPPIGWVQVDPDTGDRRFIPSQGVMPSLPRVEQALIRWVFVASSDHDLRYVLLNQVRHNLPRITADPAAIVEAVGRLRRPDRER